ncbi:TIGR03086 family protein [Pedococcus dokdonensis]|uniref:TIGR03086 family protein n=1 Tax=Pedococcus dokdonensis TaxID=443156 RepID=A0A1H0T0A9_9MICO|nr:TIGR03086 family metal-binding protein [Pedococcus dokdonensis]SDP47399.1 TIGR03086 family protein [Pedococcus dokdonensis]
MGFEVLTTSLTALQQVADGVTDDQLDASTPCAEWTVAQVLLHAAGDQHAWASYVGSGALPTYNPFDPPARPEGTASELVSAAVSAATAAWESVDPASEAVPTPLPPVPTLRADLAAAACALDAAVHAWDVAVATGQPSPLTDELAAALEPGARTVVEPLRGFAYAAPLAPEAGEGPAAALLRYLGRDPEWAA